jgi:hypothetical protein
MKILSMTLVLLLLEQEPLTRAEVAEVTRLAVAAVITTDGEIGGRPNARRPFYFDASRTFESFGIQISDTTSARELGITPAMRTGDLSLISDCDPLATGACAKLGDGAYVWVSPASAVGRTGSLTVHVHVYWATRRIQSKDQKGVRSFYSGFAREVFLVRRGRAWAFVKTGEMLVG